MTTGAGPTPEYRLGDLRIYPDRAQVFRGGTLLPIRARAVAVLVALIQQAGRVVSKEALMDLVWRDVFVEEGNVKYQIAMLRRALGHDLIETVGKVGYQIAVAPSLPEPSASRTNLPPRARALIGRDADLDLLEAQIRAHGLVTILGTGGIGKTSLADAFGRRVMMGGQESVWRLNVDGLAHPDAIAARFAAAIGKENGRGAASVEALAAIIDSEPMLLILDGCEHALPASAAFAAAMHERCAALRIVATSRIALAIPAEYRLPLEPLGVSGDEAPALRLLLDRAEAVDPRFALDDRDLPKAQALCRLLDGLPLALEIVGTRIPVLGFDALGDKLTEFCLGSADPLLNALDFSWSMLGSRGRQTLPLLAVLGSGGFGLAAAEAVAGKSLSRAGLLGGIGELVDHSLLVVERGRIPRYRLLDTTRAYAYGRLEPAERRVAHARAAAFHAMQLEGAEAGWQARPESDWLEALAPELDGLRAALAWAVSDQGDAEMAMMLAGRSTQLWSALGLYGEGRDWLERALARSHGAILPKPVEAIFWRGMGSITNATDPTASASAYRRAASLYRGARIREGEGGALVGLGMTEMMAGSFTSAERILGQARKLLARGSAENWMATCLDSLAYVYTKTGRPDQAILCLEDALDRVRRNGNQVQIAQVELNLAHTAFLANDAAAAVARAEAAVERLRTIQSVRFLDWALYNLATYLEATGDLVGAEDVVREALPLAQTRGGDVLANVVELIALLHAEAGAADVARLLGWADATAARRNRPRQPAEMTTYSRLRTRLAGALSAIRLKDAMAEGAVWTEAQAVEAATLLLTASAREDTGAQRASHPPLARDLS